MISKLLIITCTKAIVPTMTSKRNLLSKSEIDLFEKIKSEDLKGVQKLLTDQRTRQKININCFNENGSTPLFVAIDVDNIKNKNGKPIRCVKQMIQLLLGYGAQINVQNSSGKTVLYHACEYWFDGTAVIIDLLLQNGAKPNMESLKGYTPLRVACQMENVDVEKSLLLYNADINFRDNKGETPLMHACRGNIEDGVKLLLKNNASFNSQNVDGETALHIACQIQHHSTVALILRHGADPNIRDNYGRTPLHCACLVAGLFDRHMPLQMMLKYNADTNCQDTGGNTPLHCLLAFYIG